MRTTDFELMRYYRMAPHRATYRLNFKGLYDMIPLILPHCTLRYPQSGRGLFGA